jgi:subfamily B ATP-binding cassette protein HlyB/CyaB
MVLNESIHGCDTGLQCLKAVANTLGVAVDEGKITADYGGVTAMDTNILLKSAKRLNLKANLLKVTCSEFMAIHVPAIAVMQDGSYCVISSKNSTHTLLYDPSVGHPEAITLEQFFAGWSGEIIVIKKPFGMKSLLYRYNLAWFIPTIRKYKNIFMEILMASFFLQLLGLVTPLVTQVIIDKVIVNKGDATLDVLAAALFIVALFQAIMGILRTYLSAHTTNKLDIILGARLFHHLIMLPLRYFELRRVGDTLTRVAALNSIREFLTGSALTALMDVVFSIVFIIVMFYYSISLTCITLLALPFFIGQSIFVTPIYRERLEKVWATGAESNSFLVEAITGVHTIKSLAIEPQFNNKWEQLVSKYISASFRSAKFNIFNSNASSIIQKLTGFAILLFGGHKVMNGEMTVGQLVAFQMLAGQANAPIYRLTGMWQSVQQTGLSLERIGDILKVPPEPVQGKECVRLEQLKGNIVFDDIIFRYRADGREILNKVNLNITAGMKVGVVGRSGSGKSTLAKLLQRLYTPESGRISIDGNDISQLDPLWIRRQIGVVLQENYLFNGSVRQNIAFARSGASINEVIQAAKIAGAHEFILELPEGYDTMVGERGSSLSGGQQQRIAIARAILTNPSIIIFDEATSALDYESERIIMDNFAQIAAERTILMIAHRLSTVRRFDLIIVLDNGKVVEQGKHDELMERKGFYYNLYRQQEG